MEALRKQPHRTMNNVLDYLADNWHIGIISGICAWIMSSLNFMFDEDILRVVGGVGIYIGVFVAFLTGILKALDFYDNIRKRWRKKNY